MYLRDHIKFGHPVHSFDGIDEFLNSSNAVIVSVSPKDNYLTVGLRGKKDELSGHASLQCRDANADACEEIFQKIISSKIVAGKTLNELVDTKVEDL